MIKFPAPKVPAPQFKGATRSKAARRAAELRKKNFLAKAARSGLDAVTAAMAAPAINPEAYEVNAMQVAGFKAVVAGSPVSQELLSALEQRQLEIDEPRALDHEGGPEGAELSNLPHDA